MWSELIEELIEDSPFLRQIRDETREKSLVEGREEGHVDEARVMVRALARARFPTLTAADLAPIDHIMDLDHLHALVPALAAAADLEEARRLLRAVGH